MFNTLKFLQDFNISYRTKGKNCTKGSINICCPFCSDEGFHLGIFENSFIGNCWKCGKHKGEEILKAILPYENYFHILKKYNTDFIISDKINEKINHYKNDYIKIPGKKLQECHKRYLKNRKFDPDFLEKKYKLKGTLMHNLYPYSLIIPVYFNHRIISYQTRGIVKNKKYINCQPEKEIKPIKSILYNIDNCNDDWIIITEGVMKVFRLINNVCATFGKNVTIEQILLLKDYNKVFVYFDPDEAGRIGAKELSKKLTNLGKEVYIIDNDKAADDLNEKEVKNLYENIKIIIDK